MKAADQSPDILSLRAIIDSLPALIHTGRPEGYLDFFNQRWLEFVGLRLDELEGWNRTAAVHRDDVFPIRLPPLRERFEDIPLLVEYLVTRYAQKAGKKFRGITSTTLQLFPSYRRPGNIRELQNVIERAIVLCDGDTFSVDDSWLKQATSPASGPVVSLVTALEDREREIIEAALAQSRGKISGRTGAAAKLGIPRQTLDRKILGLGIDKTQFKSR